MAQIVASVGPYALIMRRPGAQRATSPAVTASPPTTRVSRSGSGACGTVASTVGGTRQWVTRSRARNSASASPPSGPAGGTTSAAPDARAISVSITDASKPGEASWSTRLPGRRPKRAAWAAARACRPVWVTATPLGGPVEPEVWMT